MASRDARAGPPPHPEEFLPLPYFPWLSRPDNLPLDVDEVATALYLARGRLGAAAERLKVDDRRLRKAIRRSPKLQRLLVRLGDARDGR
jgi:hypothetical protein